MASLLLGQFNLLNFLTSNEVVMGSPLIIICILLFVLNTGVGHSKKLVNVTKRYIVRAVKPVVLYYIVLFVWKTFFPNVALFWGMDKWLQLLSYVLIGYLGYLVVSYLGRTGRTLNTVWFVIIPTVVLMFSRLIELLK